ncbi:S41 family peptidase [Ferruginibacter yonginensis]|uniref:Tricorn protease homolog n=1 Tax=Ferruginibacter yonginensis TaxID=1310416 RepID=A0ABV8QTZ8_9BACT
MKLFFCALACIALQFNSNAQNNEAYFLSSPTLTPDAQTVIFSFEGDLWKASIKNGEATRLTAMQGYETNARVSPDGKLVAFTGRQFGNNDVFVMPIDGGNIQQITFHSGNDEVSSWSWDSKEIYFNSNRMGQIAGYKVNAKGGTPTRIFGDYFFQYDHNLAAHPTSGEIFFNDTWESSNQVQRKRYKGAFNPDIQSYNINTKQYKKYTTWEGKDFGITIDKNGRCYFISDETNGEYNLYSLDNGKKTALTQFKTSIKSPQVNANGGTVVFEKNYQLWVYDVASKNEKKLNITLNRNSILGKEKDFEVRGRISNFDISPDGKKMAFTSRGELFVSDVEGKFTQQINKGNTERAIEVKWLSDNKTLLFNQTINGYLNWYTIGADGKTALKQITNENKDGRNIALNKERTQAVYLCGRDEVRLLDLKTLQNSTLVKEEIWGFQNSAPSFSPGDQYVMFTAFHAFEQDIMVHNLQSHKTINLTNTGITEASPMWSPDGQYIYFESARLKPAYPLGQDNPHIYSLALEKIDEPFKSDKYNDLFKDEKKDTTKKTPTDVTVSIDADNIMNRINLVSPAFGSQELIAVLQKGDKTYVLYNSDHSEGRNSLWKTVIEPFEENKTEKIIGADRTSDIVAISDKYFVLAGGAINKLNLDGNKADIINISNTFRRNLQAEFAQIFEEAWAKMEINYYDENFHGVDWKKTKATYATYLPYLNTRADLRVLLNDMLGELNSSHQGFNTSGDDETISLQNRTMETGIIFENNNPYKVKYVVKRSNADKKNVDVLPGDVLVKVNNESVDENIDRNYYFSKPSIDKEITLTFKRGIQEIVTKIHPQVNLFNNLYDEWIQNNQKRVDEKSNNRIAYSCMKNMSTSELENFIIDMTQELNNKAALILDLRYNTGGNVHDEVLKFLAQKSYLKWKYREGSLANQSNFAPSDKPIVLLINEQSLSDAEMTANGFKALKLGTIIGNETYRWIIFTTSAGLVDGSSVRLPSWGCYTLDGKDLEINGVQPDIKVLNTFEDKLQNKDPQLDRAINEILKQLK